MIQRPKLQGCILLSRICRYLALIFLAAMLFSWPALTRGDEPVSSESMADSVHTLEESHEAAVHLSDWDPQLWSVSGFVLMLLSIAVIPLVAHHWWEPNRNKAIIALLLAIPFGAYIINNDWHALAHEMHEYTSFIVLLGALFVISGGIHLHGNIHCRPKNNVIFLAVGTVLASFIGTTGASMLLIRPLLSTNSERKHVMHTVIFFTFLVANIGGSLTPLGDPPLYMGYLRGVPFLWTFRLWRMWLPTSLIILSVYFILDSYFWKKETEQTRYWDETYEIPLRLNGKINFLWLLGVVAIIFFSVPSPWRELGMLALCVISWVTTPSGVREAQKFTWSPIIEVAVLFFGIFVTMVPALQILRLHGAELGVTAPWHFFWMTGSLSSFLDNTPTYLVFLSLAEGLKLTPEVALNTGGGISHIILESISCGAVFMGSMTYIGNGPNFMVKAIAEENSIKMPSFFGFMLWSIGFLVPIFIIVNLVFFRG
jgi:Na+/H+ antiporter NhaD/arsenite permease-like protein